MTRLASAFSSSGGNLLALMQCDRDKLAARTASRIVCAGDQPSAEHLAAQLKQ